MHALARITTRALAWRLVSEWTLLTRIARYSRFRGILRCIHRQFETGVQVMFASRRAFSAARCRKRLRGGRDPRRDGDAAQPLPALVARADARSAFDVEGEAAGTALQRRRRNASRYNAGLRSGR
jgi:hypothetical protein